MGKKMVSVLALFLFVCPLVFAQEIEEILEPLNKIYDLAKAGVSVVALLVLTYAGARFMFSGDNIQARENAKSVVTYAVAGLVLVWIAPVLVSFLTTP
ncbi:MAG: pilin [archaeon]|nr:pilin [archaeon]